MYDKELHGFCREFYTFVTSVQVLVSIQKREREVKVEIWRDEKSKLFVARVYIQVGVPGSGSSVEQENSGVLERAEGWAPFPNFPHVNLPKAEVALGQALGFLRDRVDK